MGNQGCNSNLEMPSPLDFIYLFCLLGTGLLVLFFFPCS